MKRILIIGGGIAGLAAAYYLQKGCGSQVHISLLEKDNTWGGKILTERVSGIAPEGEFVVEGGPDTFVVTKPWATRLCQELGIEERLRGTNPNNKKTYILKNSQLHELPGGLSLMIPTDFRAMARSGLVSWPAKFRMGCDFLLPAAAVNGDETIGAFISRRLGRSAYENLVEPLMSGIYAGDGDKLSLQSTFPFLRDLELKHGGLIRGALAVKRGRGLRASSPAHTQTTGTQSLFLTPMTGLAEIVEALVSYLEAAGVRLMLRTNVHRLDRTEDRYVVHLSDGRTSEADAVILATPSFQTGMLVEKIAPGMATELRAIEYVSTATVTLAYREIDLPRFLDGYGYVIPRKEKRSALACTWTSAKFPHRAPPGYALLRVFIGRAGQETEIDWSETGLLSTAQEELRLTLGIKAKPVFHRTHTWEKAMPQYNLGHPDRLRRIEQHLAAHPGLALAGNAYQGIGIPDCIRSGELAAAKILSTSEASTSPHPESETIGSHT